MAHVSGLDQEIIQKMVAAAALNGTLGELIATAHATLSEFRPVAMTRKLTPQEHEQTNIALEIAVRAEAALTGGGLFFRIRKRAELTSRYFG